MSTSAWVQPKVSAVAEAATLESDPSAVEKLIQKLDKIPGVKVRDRAGLLAAINACAAAHDWSMAFRPTNPMRRVSNRAIDDLLAVIDENQGPMGFTFGRERLEHLVAELKALRVPDDRVPEIELGRKFNLRIRKMMRPLADYWTVELGQKLTRNHVWDKDNRPTAPFDRFAFEIIEFLSTGKGWEIKNVKNADLELT